MNMQIQKVQSNQTSFGTKVIMEPMAARQLSLSRAWKKVLNHKKALENNGADDILYLSYFGYFFHINASVIEKRDNKYFIGQSRLEKIQEELDNGRYKYISLKKIYQKAKDNMLEVVINKERFERFI